MRLLLTILGSLVIVAYAVLGMMLANDWEVAAGAGKPLNEAIADMAEAGQPYTPIPGYVFAGLGIALAAGWALLVLRVGTPVWLAVALCSLIVTAGAAAYFFASFGNLMSVGDTYYEWHSDAAFRASAGLYLTSAFAGIVLVTTIAIGLIRAIFQRRITALETEQAA